MFIDKSGSTSSRITIDVKVDANTNNIIQNAPVSDYSNESDTDYSDELEYNPDNSVVPSAISTIKKNISILEYEHILLKNYDGKRYYTMLSYVFGIVRINCLQ